MTLHEALETKQIPQFRHPISGYLLIETDAYLCAYYAQERLETAPEPLKLNKTANIHYQDAKLIIEAVLTALLETTQLEPKS